MVLGVPIFKHFRVYAEGSFILEAAQITEGCGNKVKG